jgi:hypothetical protein
VLPLLVLLLSLAIAAPLNFTEKREAWDCGSRLNYQASLIILPDPVVA